MILKTLLAGWVELSEEQASIDVSCLIQDSREVNAGDCFVAIPGLKHDGSAFAQKAADSGATLLIVDQAVNVSVKVPVIKVPELKARAGELFARYYAHPSRKLNVIGITGTNGKTSVALMLAQLLEQLGKKSAVIGTLGAGDWNDLKSNSQSHVHTTPDAPQLQSLLNDFVLAGKEYVLMEVSSHGLEQGRLSGTHFNSAIFTNLSRDHLDYHGSMQAYGEAKSRLFQWPELSVSMINLDDGYSAELLAKAHQPLTYGLGENADYQLQNLQLNQQGLTATLMKGSEAFELTAGLLGKFNAYNLLAAIGVLNAQGFVLSELVQAAKNIQAPVGRMQLLAGNKSVVVDFAHTPDALEQVLKALQIHCQGKLHVVFGCGGDRDKGKRSEMGAIAAKLADVVWITSDNPRSEQPEQIIQDIQQGISAELVNNVHQQVDRKQAIVDAISQVGTDDWIVIAGKGHEDYQEILGQRLPFSDIATAQEAMSL